MALINWKFTRSISKPRNPGSKQTKRERKTFLFPKVQETAADINGLVELMKVMLPESFNGGPTTVEAENRVGHGEKEPNELRWNRANSYYPHTRAKLIVGL